MGAHLDPARRHDAARARRNSASRRARASPSSRRASTIRIERTAQEPLVLTMPKIGELDAHEAPPLRRRRRGRLAVLLPRLERLLPRQPGAGRRRWRRRRRLADAESAAQAAQVRALRYQVNPHFLFNTLNSLSSLVMTGRTDRAEAMLLALSTFFRTSLSLDPGADVTLAEEIELQRLYLDIEKARFPDRLNVEIDVPTELERARLPALHPPADRRECDQIWRVQKPQDRAHRDRGAGRSATGAWSSRSATGSSMAARTSCRPRPTKGPASASPMSASGSRRASAAAPPAASGR